MFNALSKEPQLSQYMMSLNNSNTIFKHNQSSFHCYPYGIFTFDKLLNTKGLVKECKNSVNIFYRKNPQAKPFSRVHFKNYQFYHLDKVKGNCIIYSSGTKSYSEVLLEEGYAIYDFLLADELWKYKFIRAQKRAQVLKKGIWKGWKLSTSIVYEESI